VTSFVRAFEESSKTTSQNWNRAQGLTKFIEPGARSYKLDLRRSCASRDLFGMQFLHSAAQERDRYRKNF
jgi:hypothetical protein